MPLPGEQGQGTCAGQHYGETSLRPYACPLLLTSAWHRYANAPVSSLSVVNISRQEGHCQTVLLRRTVRNSDSFSVSVPPPLNAVSRRASGCQRCATRCSLPRTRSPERCVCAAMLDWGPLTHKCCLPNPDHVPLHTLGARWFPGMVYRQR